MIQLGCGLGAGRHYSMLSMGHAPFTKENRGTDMNLGNTDLGSLAIIPCVMISGSSQRGRATSHGKIHVFPSPESILSHNSVLIQFYLHF